MSRSKVFSLAPFVSFVALFVYLFALRAAGDPRAQDLTLEGDEVYWSEGVWLALTIFGVLTVWLRTVWRAFRLGRTGWTLTILFLWPAAFIYVWKHERRERQPNQALQTTPMTRSVYEKTTEFGRPQRGV